MREILVQKGPTTTSNGSVTAAIGDAIGNSGWRLQSASNDQAQISRQGVIHQLSLSSR